MSAALKIISDNGASFVVGGYAIVYDGRDLTGDRFTKATDFWFDRLTHTPPVLYQHGGDAVFKRLLVGRVISKTSDEFGLWVEAQITAAKQYADAIRKLVEKGILGWSSGSVPHLVQRKSTNDPSVAEITSWPIVEISLTPTPAEPRTVGVRELKALAERDPWLLEIADEAEEVEFKAAHSVSADSAATQAAQGGPRMSDLHDAAFAFIEPGGVLDEERKTVPRANRHFHHHDENGDVDIESLKAAIAEAKQSKHGEKALGHLTRHARNAGLDLWDSTSTDDAHTEVWLQGAAPKMLALTAKMGALSEQFAADQMAQKRLGIDTKSGDRLTEAATQTLEEIHSTIGQMLEWTKSIERGEDGRMRVEMFKARLAMLQLEEVS